MSRFSKQIFSGTPATDKDWEEYLIEAHTRIPGMTQKCFSGFPTNIGPNTYELMASSLDPFRQKPIRVLDLACGDGFLSEFCQNRMSNDSAYTGLDMVDSEVKTATSKYGNDHIRFQTGRAQELPFADNSFDVVLCHLALMLMTPVEPVIDQIARVLTPGGTFTAIVGRKTSQGGMFSIMGTEIAKFIKEQLSKAASFRTGDSRLETVDGIKKLFSEHPSYSPKIDFQDFTLKISGTPNEIVEILKHFYIWNILPNAIQQKLQADLQHYLVSNASTKDKVLLELPLLKFSVQTRNENR